MIDQRPFWLKGFNSMRTMSDFFVGFSFAAQEGAPGMRPLTAAKAQVSKELGSVGGVRFCRSPLIEAGVAATRHSVQEQPINVQIKDTEDFIVRSTKRLEVLKRVEELLECQNPFDQVERDGHCRPNTISASNRVGHSKLKAKLAAVEAERDQARRNAERQHKGRPGAVQDTQPQGPAPKRACRREEHFIPNCDEEMQEWMTDRHQDLQAVVAGQLGVEPLDTGSAGVATDDRRPVRQRQHAVCGGQYCGSDGAMIIFLVRTARATVRFGL